MEIRCRCTGCAARFKVDAKYAGKKARCPKCQAVVEVPLADESTVVVPRPTAAAPAVPVKPGAKTVATGCPFCMRMITEEAAKEEPDVALEVLDIAEIVGKNLQK